jgi:hypothetical protein
LPSILDRRAPRVNLKELEQEIYEIERVRVIFLAEPDYQPYYYARYAERFPLPLDLAVKRPMVRDFINRVNELTAPHPCKFQIVYQDSTGQILVSRGLFRSKESRLRGLDHLDLIRLNQSIMP